MTTGEARVRSVLDMKNNLSAAAVAALAAFAGTIVIGDVLGREYHPIAEPVSRYVNTSVGWITVVGLFCFGIGTALTAWRTRSKVLGVASVAILVAAVFPADPPGNWSNPTLSDTIHGQAALVAFVALIVAAWRSRRALGWTVVATTIVMLVTMVDVMSVRALSTDSFPTFLGLTERIALFAYVAWMIAMVRRDRNAVTV